MFYFIRHGKTDYSEKNTKIYRGFGVQLSPLSELGILQIEEAAKDARLRDDETAAKRYQEYVDNQGEDPAGTEMPWESTPIIRERLFRILNRYSRFEKVIVACHGMLIQAVTGQAHPRNGEIVGFQLK